jgi:H+-transporting ATPase
MTVAVLSSSHNVKLLDPIDKVTIVGLKVSYNLPHEAIMADTHRITPKLKRC